MVTKYAEIKLKKGLNMNTRQKVSLCIMGPLFILSLGHMAYRDNVIKREKAGQYVSNFEKAIANFGVTEIDTADINKLSREIQKKNEQFQKQISEQNIFFHNIN